MKQRQLVRTQPPQRFQPEPTRHRPGTDMHGHPQGVECYGPWRSMTVHGPMGQVASHSMGHHITSHHTWKSVTGLNRLREFITATAQSQGLPKDSLARCPDRWRSTQQSTQGSTWIFMSRDTKQFKNRKGIYRGTGWLGLVLLWNQCLFAEIWARLWIFQLSPRELPAVPCCFPHLMIRLKGQHENCSSVTSASPEKHRVARSLFHPKKETQQVATCYDCYGCYQFLSRCVFSDLRAFNRILCRQASLRDFQVLDIRHGSPLSCESGPLMGKLDPTQHSQELSCTDACDFGPANSTNFPC